MIRKTFKYRLYPTQEQSARLTEWLNRNRELYNAALEERREAYRRAGKSITYIDQTKSLPAVREARPEYYAIPISVLRGTLKRLDLAFQAFFRRVKAGEKPGYPRFQGRNRFTSFTYQQINTTRVIDGNQAILPMLGAVKVVLHRPLVGTVKTITVRRDGDQWYVCFSCECVDEVLPADDTAVGIDLGVAAFATLSTGEQIANPRFLRRALGNLQRKQQALSRCQRGSHRRDRARRAVARAHQRVRNRRADFLHQTARRLVNEYGTIVMEALQPANLSKRPKARANADGTGYEHNGAAQKTGLNLSIRDAGWARFQALCTVKAEWAGRRVVLVNPAYTSQMCSGCGQIRKKALSERWHSCECGCELDRDHNAAINILRAGIR
jgi:putative transposase